jgi:hypothetical protein
MARSRLSGVSKLRRTLRRIPDAVTADVRKEVKVSAELVEDRVDAIAPARSIRENTTVKLARDGLTATVGLHGKRANRRGFLGRLFEFGTKPHVIVPRADGKRNSRKRAAGKSVPGSRVLVATTPYGFIFFGKTVNHPGMRKRPFFFGTFKGLRPAILGRIKKAIGVAIRTASNG